MLKCEETTLFSLLVKMHKQLKDSCVNYMRAYDILVILLLHKEIFHSSSECFRNMTMKSLTRRVIGKLKGYQHTYKQSIADMEDEDKDEHNAVQGCTIATPIHRGAGFDKEQLRPHVTELNSNEIQAYTLFDRYMALNRVVSELFEDDETNMDEKFIETVFWVFMRRKTRPQVADVMVALESFLQDRLRSLESEMSKLVLAEKKDCSVVMGNVGSSHK